MKTKVAEYNAEELLTKSEKTECGGFSEACAEISRALASPETTAKDARIVGEMLLKQMQQNMMQPSIITYNAAISACERGH